MEIDIRELPKAQLAIGCLICGEDVPIESPSHHQYLVCDECKKAVMFIRKQMNDKVYSKTSPIKLSKKSLQILNEKEMRSFTKEEQEEYRKGLNKIYKPTGVKLFDKE